MLVPALLFAVATSYRIVDLGVPPGGGEAAEAVAINERDEVAVSARGGFIWRKGRWISLGAPTYGGNTDGTSMVEPRAMNNYSIVVGDQGPGGPVFHSGLTDSEAFIWRGKQVAPVGFGILSGASGINDKGDVVGTANHRAYVRIAGKVQRLGTLSKVPSGNLSWAVAINNRRQVVGTSTYGGAADDTRAFLYEKGRMQALRVPSGAEEGRAFDINDAGLVLAAARDKGEVPYLTRLGRTSRLAYPWPTLRIVHGGLNERGDVVATAADGTGTLGGMRPALWLRGRWTAFPAFAGWELKSARGINNRGWICGTALREGKPRAFVLVPQ